MTRDTSATGKLHPKLQWLYVLLSSHVPQRGDWPLLAHLGKPTLPSPTPRHTGLPLVSPTSSIAISVTEVIGLVRGLMIHVLVSLKLDINESHKGRTVTMFWPQDTLAFDQYLKKPPVALP